MPETAKKIEVEVEEGDSDSQDIEKNFGSLLEEINNNLKKALKKSKQCNQLCKFSVKIAGELNEVIKRT